MAEESKPSNTEKVKCEVCLKEIPASEAQSAEAQDYVAHFCGLECYERWKKRGHPARDPNRRP